MGVARTPQQIAAINTQPQAPVPVPKNPSSGPSVPQSNPAPALPVAVKNPTSLPAGATNLNEQGKPVTENGIIVGPAPMGAKKSGNGNYVDSSGNQYTMPPGTVSEPNGSDNPLLPSMTSVAAAEATQTETADQLEQGELSYEDRAVQQAQSLIDAIEAPYQEQITKAEKDAAGAGSAAGFQGTIAEGSMEESATAPIIASMNKDVQSAIQSVQDTAASHYETLQNDAETNAGNVIALSQQGQQALQTSFKSIATNFAGQGLSISDFQKQYPDEYSYMLQYGFNGDFNAMQAAYALAIPPSQVVQTWTNGTTYNQLTRNPQTNALTVQSFDTGIAVPAQWTSNKISTNTIMMQDPNNPANTVIYTTDPLTGGVTVSGTGTGLDLANQYNQAGGGGNNDNPTPPSPAPAGGAGTASTTISSILGVDPTTPLSQVLSEQGIGALTAAMIKNEGGSPAGVDNNPGNIKYDASDPMPGSTDSGVKATDGGTFASFKTPEEGEAAIASIANAAASGKTTAYGSEPTLQSFVDAYTNTGKTAAADTGSNGLSTQQYGLLANVPGFDPGPSSGNKTDAQAVDSAAFNYLQVYLKTGSIPTTTNVLGMRSGTSAQLPRIAQRAQDLYTQATRQALPDQDILDNNKTLVEGNNALLNSLAVQEKTISANSDLLQGKITAANLNQNAPIINKVLDPIIQALGNVPVAAYNAQVDTLGNELGSLLALKNASGTTVHDKLISAGLLPADASAQQEADVVNTIMQEAQNAHGAIGAATETLYQQVDPLGLNPSNPINAPGYKDFTSLNFTNNYDGTWTAPDQTIWKTDSSGAPVQVQ